MDVFMEDNIVIDIQHAAVRFNLASERVDSLKEYFIKLAKHELLFQEFMALQDITLQIRKGESWGFVGANGAGKSTLLKLICGILKPYNGTVRTVGRISPLLELGAGFNPELTARENIYLNAAVLGYKKRFIKEHFEEIVDFAGLWDFLDVPIKNYSSGMAARLGFSVATMVRPEILIVDEILAVGDYSFQQKCKTRMHEMFQGGTTLIFVSHDTKQVEELCRQALWLDKGRVKMQGESGAVCGAYMEAQKAL